MNQVISAIYISVSILLFTLIGIVTSFPQVSFSYSHSIVPWLPWLLMGLGIFYLVKKET
mgnify:CR=1 FL=1